MAKELVISSNRHETKVAILEDDQLVEVFFQRAKEYSLAGSIHKGRVTRVLPGMQSAFVDLGLDRDTFLYVSDFFEENDEYDKIGDDRPARTPRTEAQAAVTVPPPVERMAPLAGVSAIAQSEKPSAGGERTDDRGVGGGDRRNRRSRRRRGRERGLPDSKYASDVESTDTPAVAEQAEAVPEAVAVESTPEAGDSSVSVPVLLPGETLRKYSRPNPERSEAPEAVAPVEARVSEPAPAVELAPEPTVEAPEVAVEAEEAPVVVAEAVELLAEAEPEVEEPAIQQAAGPALTELEESEIREMILEAQLDAERRSKDEEPEVVKTVDVMEAGEDVAEIAITEAGPVTEAEADVDGDGEPDVEADADADSEVEPVAESVEEVAAAEAIEGEETASAPASLTANVREQGQRYPHRTSRRMRRKVRGDGSGPAAAGTGEPEVRETRTEHKPAPRAERSEPRAEVKPDVREARPMPLITDLLREGQEIIVQIAKEPLGQKGARITSHIAMPGRYVVYMPTLEHMGVSRKIESDEERLRLKRILNTHRAGMQGGFILRTAGEGKTEEEIAADMNFLFSLWLDIRQKAEKRKAPVLLHHDLDIVQRLLRDQFTETFKAIWTDNEEVYESVLGFVQRFQPTLVGRVKLYTRPAPIFDSFNITQELEKALRPKVWLKSGGYIVINQTEALVAIDVNTGKFVGKSNRLEDTIVKTNTEAVKEIVRQMRLRDLGGIIVIDFIDMDERKNRQKVMQALEEAMRADRAPYKILQFNDFGLVAITRKRVKQSLERTLCSPCPYCEGAGYVKSVQTVVGEILQEAHKIVNAVEGNVILRVNPEVGKVLKSTENKYLEELESILGKPVLVRSDALLHQEKFDLA